jgi:hypothetical protein
MTDKTTLAETSAGGAQSTPRFDIAVSLLFVMLVAQVVFAAGFLGGGGLMFARHRANALDLTVVAFVVSAMAMLY